jgi:hypothetical protein
LSTEKQNDGARAAPRLINQPSHYMPSALSPFFLLTRTCQVLQNGGLAFGPARARAVALALACRAVGRRRRHRRLTPTRIGCATTNRVHPS